MSVTVSQLNIYPIKSCRGTQLQKAEITKRGFLHDRSSLLISTSGLALTQRDYPNMALIHPEAIDENTLRLSAPKHESFVLNFSKNGRPLSCKVWDDTCESIDQGDEVAKWFQSVLGCECRLVRMPDNFIRPVSADYKTADEQQVGFADGYPFLIISEESLDDLNSKLEVPVPMNRFRPNIVVKGCKPFAEDEWKRIRIAGVDFDIVKPCARCVIITIDQEYAEISKEPMRTLTGYRMLGKKVMFGQNVVHHSTGKMQVGDEVQLIS